jgi:hypothetical protein
MIDPNIDSKINELVSDVPSIDRDAQEAPVDAVFTGESEQVAALGKLLKKAKDPISETVKKSLSGLEESGARTLRDPTVVAPTQRMKEVAPAKMPEQLEIPDTPTPLDVKPKSKEVIEEISKERKKLLDEGAPPVSPSPGPRQELVLDGLKFEDVGTGRISTVPFDDESLRATIQATTEKFVGKDLKSTTVQDLYNSAVERGIPETIAQNMLKGIPFESKIGGNQLALNMTGMLKLLDDSSIYIDRLFKKLEQNYSTFTDIDRFNLGQQLAYHESLLNTVSGASSDIARAMNTFKRAKDTMPLLEGPEFKSILDGTISKEAMLDLAKRYNLSESRAGKNKLIGAQKGLYTKISEIASYTFRTNLLSDPETVSRNVISSSIHGSMISVEDIIGVGISKVRGKLSSGNIETQNLDDVINGLYGFHNGAIDGFEFMAHVMKTGRRADYKGTMPSNPLSSEYLANTDITLGFGDFSKTFRTNPDLKDTFWGRGIDALGFVQSIPVRMLSGTDEQITGTVARMALHRESSKYARSRINELTSSGMSLDDATDIVRKEVTTFLREQPADIYANVEEVRKMVNFSYNFNKFTENAIESNVAGAYDKVSRLFDIPGVKVLQPFAATITKMFDQGASRIPGLNFISPQFYKDWNRGGAYKDRAIARLTLGSTIGATMAVQTMDNKCTGFGPGAPEDREALQKLGWMPYSCVIDTEISPENMKRLEKITRVSVGEGKTYVSFQGFEPLTDILSISADFGENMKFYDDNPGASEVGDLAMAIAGAAANRVEEMPFLGAVGDLLSITRGKYEDKGEKVAEVFERISTEFGKAGMLAVPGLSLPATGAASHLARVIDRPTVSTMPDNMNPTSADRFMQETWKSFASRVPVLRGEYQMELDNAGRPKYSRNSYLESYINFVPGLKVSKGQASRMDEVLVENNHGISRPSKKIDGVEMSAEQYNRFKRLYGQEILLEVFVGNKLVNLNMENAIPVELEEAIKDRELSGMSPMDEKQRQEIINATISRYRKAAKERMLGVSEEDMSTGKKVYIGVPVKGKDYGFSDDVIEFPDLLIEINRLQ